jgi:hypothetical protein
MPFQGNFPDEGKESIHWAKFEASGRMWYSLSGVVKTTFKGVGGGWERGTLIAQISIPDLPVGMGLKIEHWVPYAALNSVANDGPSNNAAWAVDTFSLHGFDTRPVTSVELDCQLATRDVDGYVLRVGYHIDLVGVVTKLQ